MGKAADELLERALRLDEADRAAIAAALIDSLHAASTTNAQVAREAEVRRRARELDAGVVKAVPWSEARERLFRDLE